MPRFRDPDTGRFLPTGFGMVMGEPWPRDSHGRFMSREAAELIVEGWRSREGLPYKFYTTWQDFRAPGASRARDDVDAARNLIQAAARIADDDPDTAEEYLEAGSRILGGIGGGAPVAFINTRLMVRVKPLANHHTPPLRYARPGRGVWPWANFDEIQKAKGFVITPALKFAQYDRLPTNVVMEEVHRIAYQNSLGRCHTPAILAWRLFRSYLKEPLPRIPTDMLFLCAEALDRYYILPPTEKEADVYVYDINCAYGAILAQFPDLSLGRWVRVNQYAGPIAVYQTRSGVFSGTYVASMGMQKEVEWGYAWKCPDKLSRRAWENSPFRRFVEFCYYYRGPARRLMRRLPVFVVGKSWSHTFVRKEALLDPHPTWYPILWVLVQGALHARMEKTAMGYDAVHGFVDSLHLKEPLPEDLVGDGLGQWKLQYIGRIVYRGLNRYQGDGLYKHQGIRLKVPETSPYGDVHGAGDSTAQGTSGTPSGLERIGSILRRLSSALHPAASQTPPENAPA